MADLPEQGAVLILILRGYPRVPHRERKTDASSATSPTWFAAWRGVGSACDAQVPPSGRNDGTAPRPAKFVKKCAELAALSMHDADAFAARYRG